MNNLNTTLLEGTLKNNPNSIGNHACELTIVSRRTNLCSDGQWREETSEFPALVSGTVADTCMNILSKGRAVRVVGRLKQFKWMTEGVQTEKTMIIVEHIEFMPKAV